MTRKLRCSNPEGGDDADIAPTVWLDSWAGEVVVTLTVPEDLAHAVAEAIQELTYACSAGGSDAQAAEVAGLLVGLLDGVRIFRRLPMTPKVPVDA